MRITTALVLYVSFYNHILLHTKNFHTYKFLAYQLTLFGNSVEIIFSWLVEPDLAAAAVAARAALDIALVFVRVTLVCSGSTVCSVDSSLTVCNFSNVVIHPRTVSQACGLSKTTVSLDTKFCT